MIVILNIIKIWYTIINWYRILVFVSSQQNSKYENYCPRWLYISRYTWDHPWFDSLQCLDHITLLSLFPVD